MPRIHKVHENLFSHHGSFWLFKNLHAFIGNKAFRNECDVYFMGIIDCADRPASLFFLQLPRILQINETLAEMDLILLNKYVNF